MKVVAAALGNDSYLTTDGAAIFRWIVRGQYLHLLDRIQVGRSDGISAGADANCDGTIVGQQIIAFTAAIDVECAKPSAEAERRDIA